MNIPEKYLFLKLKEGWSVSDFCNAYKCSSEEFIEYLREKYRDDQKRLNGIMKDLRINKNIAGTAKDTSSSQPAKEVVEKSVKESLCDRERLLNSKKEHLRGEFRNYLNNYNAYNEALHIAIGKLKELQQKVEEAKALIFRNSVILDDYAQEISKILGAYAEANKELADVRKEIEELDRISFSVHSDGTIVPITAGIEPSQYDVAPDSNLTVKLFEKLYCEELTLKEVKLLAKVITIKNSNYAAAFEFEKPEVKAAYDQYVAETKA